MPSKDNRFTAKDILRIIKKHLTKEEVSLVWAILRKSKGCSLTVDDLIYMICANLPPMQATAFYDRLFRNPCGFNYGLTPYAMLQVYDMTTDKTAFLKKLILEKEKGDWVEYLQKDDLNILLNVILADQTSPFRIANADELCQNMIAFNDYVGLISIGVAAMVAVDMILGVMIVFFPSVAGVWLGRMLTWVVGFQALLIAVGFAVDGLNQFFNLILLPAFKCSLTGTGLPIYNPPPLPEMTKEELERLFGQGRG